MMRTYNELKSVIENKGYRFFNDSINLIGERTSDVFTNQFTDYLHIANKGTVETISWTTKAGTYYVENPLTAWGTNIKTLQYENIQGVAVLKEGQYLQAYQFIDSYFGWLQYPYFQQVKDVLVYRDNDLDTHINRNSPIHFGNFGVNLHRMSNNGQAAGFIHNWSAGCNGTTEVDFKKLLIPVREDVKKFGNIFSYTLLNSEDF